MRDDETLIEGGKKVVQPFNSATVKLLPPYDANKDGKVWVRSVGVIQCRLVTVVSLISEQLGDRDVPHERALRQLVRNHQQRQQGHHQHPRKRTAGWRSEHAMRPTVPVACENYRPGQVQPDTTSQSKPAPNPAIPASEPRGFGKVAVSKNMFFPESRKMSGVSGGGIRRFTSKARAT